MIKMCSLLWSICITRHLHLTNPFDILLIEIFSRLTEQCAVMVLVYITY